ncbi:MAG: SH3 domain-containing protein [Desulfobulbaceae bacterium]|nr:SH3 domain-containing protein [Desulfobulbaceae bacterium]
MKQNISKHFRFTLQALTVLLTFCFVLSAGAAEYVVVKNDGVNVRSGPGRNNEILWEVFKNYPLKVTKRVNQKDGQWAETVDFEGDKGWISASLLSKKKLVIVSVDAANLRIGPDTNYEIIATVKYGVVFTPLTKEGEWVKVQHNDGTIGWLHEKLIWPKD